MISTICKHIIMEGLYKSDKLYSKINEATKKLEFNNLQPMKSSNVIEIHNFLGGKICERD